MLIFFFRFLENLCGKRGGRKLMQIEVFSHYHNFIGFKVTMTVLHVCTFAVGFPLNMYVAANMVERGEENENEL